MIRLPIHVHDRQLLVGVITTNADTVAMLLDADPTMFTPEIHRDGASHGVGILGPFAGVQHLPMRPADTILAGTLTLAKHKGVLTVFGASHALVIIPDMVH